MTATARDGSALLDAIKADPGEDLPRLAYADWCEENENGDRAEFIRVQIGIEDGEYFVASQRDFDILSRHPDWDAMPFPSEWVFGVGAMGEYSHARHFRRGFVESVRCPLAMWLRHGKAIMAAHPVQRVELSDREPCRGFDDPVNHPAVRPVASWCDEGERLPLRWPDCKLPPALFALLAKNGCDGLPVRGDEWKDYPTREAALDALSAACLAYATGPIESTPPGVG